MMDEWFAAPDQLEVDCHMASKASAKRLPPDEARVAPHVSALREAGFSRVAFESAFSALKTDAALTVSDSVEIALQYRGGGVRPASRKSALEAISNRFLELVRNQAQVKQASKARPW